MSMAAAILDQRMLITSMIDMRDELILEVHADGCSLRSIAAMANVSHQTIANVVAAGASTTTETQCRPPV
jgi:hypothetical protein